MKKKKCNGNYRVNKYAGCGKMFDSRTLKFGLCRSCLFDWSYNTDEGKIWFEKQKPISENIIAKENNKSKQESLIKLMKPDQYRATYLQPKINEIARLIDYGQPCIVRGVSNVKMDGGHFFSVNSNRTISLNLHNIHQQSNDSNKWEGGCPDYRLGIVNTYGKEYAEFIDSLKQTPLIKLKTYEMIELNKKATEIIKDLKKDLKPIERPEGRILERNRINCLLDIYPDKYLVF